MTRSKGLELKIFGLTLKLILTLQDHKRKPEATCNCAGQHRFTCLCIIGGVALVLGAVALVIYLSWLLFFYQHSVHFLVVRSSLPNGALECHVKVPTDKKLDICGILA